MTTVEDNKKLYDVLKMFKDGTFLPVEGLMVKSENKDFLYQIINIDELIKQFENLYPEFKDKR